MAVELVFVRMPRRGGGQIERLAITLSHHPELKRVRVEFCDCGQRAHVAPHCITPVSSAEVATC